MAGFNAVCYIQFAGEMLERFDWRKHEKQQTLHATPVILHFACKYKIRIWIITGTGSRDRGIS